MLPLVRGLPVFLTNHIDRSEKALLRGRAGTLLGWQLDDKEPQPPQDRDHFLRYAPKCVYVQFHDTLTDGQQILPGWSIVGLGRGVYAISPKPEYWYLDAKQSYSHIRISRHQLPIAPDFARTAYSMQGFTLLAGKIDLQLSKNMDAVTAYVAMSRFKTADDILILQPFALEVFQQGAPQQAELLLKYIGLENKEDIHADIAALQARMEEERAAKRLKTTQDRSARMSAQNAAGSMQGLTPAARDAKKHCKTQAARDAKRHCKTQAARDAKKHCKTQEARDKKSGKGEKRGKYRKRLTAECSNCHQHKSRDEYTKWQWHERNKPGFATCCRACTN